MNLSILSLVYICEPVIKNLEAENVGEIEKLISQEKISIERFVKFKINVKEDAQDIMQDIFETAIQKYDTLKNRESFKAWLISIARNKCNDYFRQKAKTMDIPVENILEKKLVMGNHGYTEVQAVKETLEGLGDKDKQILYLYFWKEMPMAEIAQRLKIPLGTVKSRLFTAKKNFKEKWKK